MRANQSFMSVIFGPRTLAPSPDVASDNRKVPMPSEPPHHRRNLVIVRAGDASLHPQWLAGAGDRNWDLVVSYFGKDPAIYRINDVVRIDSTGPKWAPLQRLMLDHPEYLDRYDYIWFPDDDLAMTKQDMNRFFDLCRDYGLELAQPSLTTDSPMNHPLLINNTASHIRFTNFVEVMAPCFSAACLRRVLPTFSATQSGWGIDWLWPRMVQDRDSGIAVIDDVVIRHTRPLGGPNYDAMRAKGQSPLDELLKFQEREGIEHVRIEVHKVFWRSKWVKPSRPQSLAFRLKLLAGHVRAVTASPIRGMLLRQVLGRFKRPITNG